MMAFDVINIGTTANDGTGDPLRTAFNKTNDNFAKAVEGPSGTVTADTVALFDGTTGKVIKGGGKANADLVVGPASVTSGRVAVYDGTTGKLLQDGTRLEADLVAGPASATDGAVALYDQTTGKLLKDGPVPGAASGLATLDAAQRVLQGHTLRHPGRNNHWVSPPGVTTGTIASTLNWLRLGPVVIPGFTRFNGIGIEVTGAAAAGGICRIGLYRPRSDGDLDLIIDFGSVATDTTGVKTISNNFELNPGVYFTAAVPQVETATYRTVTTTGVYISQDAWYSNLAGGGLVTNVSGALPSTTAVNLGNTANSFLVRLRLRVP